MLGGLHKVPKGIPDHTTEQLGEPGAQTMCRHGQFTWVGFHTLVLHQEVLHQRVKHCLLALQALPQCFLKAHPMGSCTQCLHLQDPRVSCSLFLAPWAQRWW